MASASGADAGRAQPAGPGPSRRGVARRPGPPLRRQGWAADRGRHRRVPAAGDPALAQARDAARSLLYPPAAEAAGGAGGDDLRAAVAAWSLVHGLVTLWLNGNLPPQLGDDPEQLVREVAGYLF